MPDNFNDPLNPNATTAPDEASQPVAFCQDCGRPLTRETMRAVGTGVFCEPCLQGRLAAGMPGTIPPPSAATGTMPPVPGEPSPALAGLLGLLPGVGAMYNGQFAKGIAHIAIFAILVSLSNHVSDIFGFVVAGWIFYMVFDAIHTARARRDGLPLPNTFGLNDIGERVGYGRTWASPANVNTAPPAAQPSAGQPPYVPPAAQATWSEVPPPATAATAPPPNAAAYANWAGYVPPTAFGAAAATPPPPSAIPAPASYAGVYTPPAEFVMPPVGPSRRFPVAAVILIAFGLLFLIANIVPSWNFSEHWAVPLVLAIWAAWVLARRIGSIDQLRTTAAISGRPYIIAVIRFPLILATISLMFVLQNLNIATMAQTWPLLLIVIGGLALVDRAGAYTPHLAVPVPTSVVPPVSGAAPEAPRADFTAGGDAR